MRPSPKLSSPRKAKMTVRRVVDFWDMKFSLSIAVPFPSTVPASAAAGGSAAAATATDGAGEEGISLRMRLSISGCFLSEDAALGYGRRQPEA